tara:strand:- start:14060 stop:21655 length:7596 start_codon:yes stop_codon:yes gene_type:complete
MSYSPDIIDTYRVINERMIIKPWHLSPPQNIGTDDHSSVLTPEEFAAYCDKYITFIIKNRIKMCVFLVGSPGNPAYGYCNPNYMAPDTTIYPNKSHIKWGRNAGYVYIHTWVNGSSPVQYKLSSVVNEPSSTSSLIQAMSTINTHSTKINNVLSTVGTTSTNPGIMIMTAPGSPSYTPGTGAIISPFVINCSTNSIYNLYLDGIVINKADYSSSTIPIISSLNGQVDRGWSISFTDASDSTKNILCEITTITETTDPSTNAKSWSVTVIPGQISTGAILNDWNNIDSSKPILLLASPSFKKNAWYYVPALTHANTRVVENTTGTPLSGALYSNSLNNLQDSYLHKLEKFIVPANSTEFPALDPGMIRYRWTVKSTRNENYYVPWLSTFLFERLPPEVKVGINITLDPKYAWGQYSTFSTPAVTLSAMSSSIDTTYTKGARTFGEGTDTHNADTSLTEKNRHNILLSYAQSGKLLDSSLKPTAMNLLSDATNISTLDQRWCINTFKDNVPLFNLPYGDPNGYPIKSIGETYNYSNNLQRGDGETVVHCIESGKLYMPSTKEVLPRTSTNTDPTNGMPVVCEYARRSVMGTTSVTESSYARNARYFPQNYPPSPYKSYQEEVSITQKRTYYPKDNLRQAFELVAYINTVSTRLISEIAIDKEDMGNYNGSGRNPYPWPPSGNDIHNLIQTEIGNITIKGWDKKLEGGYAGYGGQPGLLIGKGYMKWLFDMYMPQSQRVNNPCHTPPDPAGVTKPDGIGEMLYPNWGNDGKYGIGYINYNVASFDQNADHIGPDQYVGTDPFNEIKPPKKQGSMWPQNNSQGGGLPYMYNRKSDLHKSLSVGSNTPPWPTEFGTSVQMTAYIDDLFFPEIYFGSSLNPIQIKVPIPLNPTPDQVWQQYDSGIYQPSGFIVAYSELYWIGELKTLKAKNKIASTSKTGVYDYTGGSNVPPSSFGGCGCGFDINPNGIPTGDGINLPCQFNNGKMFTYCQNPTTSKSFNYPCILGILGGSGKLEPYQCSYQNCIDTGTGGSIYSKGSLVSPLDDFKNKPTNILNAIFNCYFDTDNGTLVSDQTTIFPSYGTSPSYNLSSINHCSFGETNNVKQWPRALNSELKKKSVDPTKNIYYGNNALPTFSFEYISKGNIEIGILKIPPTNDTWVTTGKSSGTFNPSFISEITLYDRCDATGTPHSYVDPVDMYKDIINVDGINLFVGTIDNEWSASDGLVVSQNLNYITTEHVQSSGKKYHIPTLSAWSSGNLGFRPTGTITQASVPLGLNTGDLFKRLTKVSGTFDGWGTWDWDNVIDMLNTMTNSYEVNRFSYYEVAFITMDHFINETTDTNHISPLYNFWGYDTRRGDIKYSTFSSYPSDGGIAAENYCSTGPPCSINPVTGYGNISTITGNGQTLGVLWGIDGTSNANPCMGYSISQNINYTQGINGASPISVIDGDLESNFNVEALSISGTVSLNNSVLYDPAAFHIENKILSGSSAGPSSNRLPAQSCIYYDTFAIFPWSSVSDPSTLVISTNIRNAPSSDTIPLTGGIITDVVISDNRYLISNLFNNANSTSNFTGADLVVLVAEKITTGGYNIWAIPYYQYNKYIIKVGLPLNSLNSSIIINVPGSPGTGAFSLTVGIDGLLFWYEINNDASTQIIKLSLRCGGYLTGGAFALNQEICQYDIAHPCGIYYQSIFNLTIRDSIPLKVINTWSQINTPGNINGSLRNESFTLSTLNFNLNTFAQSYKIITIGETTTPTFLTMWEIDDVTTNNINSVKKVCSVNTNILIPRKIDGNQVQNINTYYNSTLSVITAINYTKIGNKYKIYGVLFDLAPGNIRSTLQTTCEFEFNINNKEKLNWYYHANNPNDPTESHNKINKITIDSKNNLYINSSNTGNSIAIFDCDNGPTNGSEYTPGYKTIANTSSSNPACIDLFDSFSGCTTNSTKLLNNSSSENTNIVIPRKPNVSISDMSHALLQTKNTSINSVTISIIDGITSSFTKFNTLSHIMPHSSGGSDTFTQGLNVIYSDGTIIKTHRLNSYRGNEYDKSCSSAADTSQEGNIISHCRITNSLTNSYSENNASYILCNGGNNLQLINPNKNQCTQLPNNGTIFPGVFKHVPFNVGSLNMTDSQLMETSFIINTDSTKLQSIVMQSNNTPVPVDVENLQLDSGKTYITTPLSIVKEQIVTSTNVSQLTTILSLVKDSTSTTLMLSQLKLSRDIPDTNSLACSLTCDTNTIVNLSIANATFLNFIPYYTRMRSVTAGYQDGTSNGSPYGATLISSRTGELILIQNNTAFINGGTQSTTVLCKQTNLPKDTSKNYILSMYNKYTKDIPSAQIDPSFQSPTWVYHNPVVGFDSIYMMCTNGTSSLLWVLDMFTLSVKSCIQLKNFKITSREGEFLKIDNYGRIHLLSWSTYYCIDRESFKPGDFSEQKQKYNEKRWNHSPNDYSKIITPCDWLYQNINIEDFFNSSKGGGFNKGGVVKISLTVPTIPWGIGYSNISISDQDVVVNDSTNVYHIHIDTKKDCRRPCVNAVNNGNCFYYPFIGV